MPSRKTKETEAIVKDVVKSSSTVKSAKAGRAEKKNAKKETKKVATSKRTKKEVEKKVSSKKDTKSTAKTSKKVAKTTSKSTTKSSTKKATTSTRKRTSTKAPKIDVLEYYDLPYRYNQTVVKILAQTPNTLFVYWDISDEDRNKYKAQFGENVFETTRPVLVVHNDTKNYAFEVPINDFANSWYLHLNDTKCTYTIELGRRPITNQVSIPNNYLYVSSSNHLETPNDHILFEKSSGSVFFKDVHTNEVTKKDISTLSFMKRIGKIYNIYELYQTIYQKEDLEEFKEFLNNPSSNNPTSTFK